METILLQAIGGTRNVPLQVCHLLIVSNSLTTCDSYLILN